MTDITLFISDPSFRRLLRLELERIEKTVGESGEDCFLLITDTHDVSDIFHKRKILITRGAESNKTNLILRRPVDMQKLRILVSEIFKQTETNHEQKTKNDTSIKLIKEEKSARIGETKIHLTENEFILLSALKEKSGELISREEINSLLNSSGNTPEVYICTLRKKLTVDDGVNPIITVREKGYKLR